MNEALYEAEKLFRKIEIAPAMSYAKEQLAIHETYQRLKAERLAREAATGIIR